MPKVTGLVSKLVTGLDSILLYQACLMSRPVEVFPGISKTAGVWGRAPGPCQEHDAHRADVVLSLIPVRRQGSEPQC